jgi:hypothetical protein
MKRIPDVLDISIQQSRGSCQFPHRYRHGERNKIARPAISALGFCKL